MAYAKPSDVRLLIQTDLKDDELEDLIALADDELDQRLGGATMGTDQKKNCSMRLAAVTVAQRGPASYSIGSVRVQQGDRVEKWERYVKVAVKRCRTAKIEESPYQKIDESKRFTEEAP